MFKPKENRLLKIIKHDKITIMKFFFLKVFLHQPNVPPESHVGVMVHPGSESSILVKVTKKQSLQEPYGYCHPYHETSNDTEYSCLYRCMQENVIQRCDCFSPYYSRQNLTAKYVNLTFCGDVNEPNEVIKERLECLLRMMNDTYIFDECDKQCPQACVEYLYSTHQSTTAWPHEVFHDSYYYKYLADMKQFPKEMKNIIENGYASKAIPTLSSIMERNLLKASILLYFTHSERRFVLSINHGTLARTPIDKTLMITI